MKFEYVIRIGFNDRYRHLHVQERGKMDRDKQMMERNIELSAEFSRYLFEHPEMEGRIPKEAEVILLPEFDDELKEHNLQLGRQVECEGAMVIYVTIKQLRPKTLSRIEGVGLEAAV